MTERDRIIHSLSPDEILLFVGLGGRVPGMRAVWVLDALAEEISPGAELERVEKLGAEAEKVAA